MEDKAENAPAEEEKAKAEKAARDAQKPPPPTMTKTSVSKPKPVVDGNPDMRGYKVTADGKKTTFFNNDLTEEEKALIGDIAPKKVENTVQVNQGSAGSAWSNGTTYEERDLTKWATKRMKELILEAAFTIPADELAALGSELGGEDNGTFTVKKVTGVEGDASIPIIRGKTRYVYNLSCKAEWRCSINGEEHKGELHIPEISSDDSDIFEDADNTFKTERSRTGPVNQLLRKYLKGKAIGLQSSVHGKLTVFSEEFKQK